MTEGQLYDYEVRKITRLIQEAIDKIKWEKHGIKKTGTLTRSTGMRLLTDTHDFQLFADMSANVR
jgi:hypothetical protein